MLGQQPANRTVEVIERVSRLLQSQARGNDLHPAQRDALLYLSRANKFSRNPSAVACFMAATKGTTSQTLIALIRKGLVAKSPKAGDRRGVVLDLTEHGAALVSSANASNRLAEAVALLPPLHISIIAQTLNRILDELIVQNGARNFGVCASCAHFLHDAHPGRSEGPNQCSRFNAPLTKADAAMICVEHANE